MREWARAERMRDAVCAILKLVISRQTAERQLPAASVRLGEKKRARDGKIENWWLTVFKLCIIIILLMFGSARRGESRWEIPTTRS
jgi:hypothetical protein